MTDEREMKGKKRKEKKRKGKEKERKRKKPDRVGAQRRYEPPSSQRPCCCDGSSRLGGGINNKTGEKGDKRIGMNCGQTKNKGDSSERAVEDVPQPPTSESGGVGHFLNKRK